MNSEIELILKNIESIKNFDKYTEFPLKENIDMDNENMKQLIIDLNNKTRTVALYNSVTKTCDTIGVLDMNNIRTIDFEDNNFTLMNKGIDRQTNIIEN